MAELRLCQIQIKGVPCTEEAKTFFDGGCVHEHVTPNFGVCSGHLERVTGDPWTCHVCERADGHKCPVVIREVVRD